MFTIQCPYIHTYSCMNTHVCTLQTLQEIVSTTITDANKIYHHCSRAKTKTQGILHVSNDILHYFSTVKRPHTTTVRPVIHGDTQCSENLSNDQNYYLVPEHRQVYEKLRLKSLKIESQIHV